MWDTLDSLDSKFHIQQNGREAYLTADLREKFAQQEF